MLVRWNPWNEVSRLQSEMNRLFNGSINPASVRTEGEDLVRGTWSPEVDVTEDPEKITLHADLPGISQQDIDIKVEQDVLTLSGVRKLERPQRGAGKDQYYHYERTAGTFLRSFSLPPTVDAEKISAAVRDGVLTLILPKRPEAQPRQIKVKVQ